MAETAHTPGPWMVALEGRNLRVWAGTHPNRFGIADICVQRSITAKGPSAVEEANASLIAAAPELHATLTDILRLALPDVGAKGGLTEHSRKLIWTIAREALNKAKATA